MRKYFKFLIAQIKDLLYSRISPSVLVIYSLIFMLGIFFSVSIAENSFASQSNISGLVYVNDLERLTSDQYSKLKNTSEVKYILNQMILYPSIYSGSNLIERDRIVELAHLGKRMIIQVWFGPGSYYNWSYCGYPNIAMQNEVRDYLFSVIDKAIDQIGPEHIYGMHLLEEDGHFAVDIDEPGRWWMNKGAVLSGTEDGDPYSNYKNLRALYNGPSDWCQAVPNVAQYYPEFKAKTGLDMHNLPANDPFAYPVLDRWMARSLWAGAHRAFHQHLREKYPTIRNFVWGHIAYYWNGTDLGNLKDIIDGVVISNYNDTLYIHHTLSGIRSLLPEAEMLVLLEDSTILAEKHIRVATAYVNGSSAVGFFGTLQNPALWNTSVQIWQEISVLPVITSIKPKVLIVSGNTDNGYSTSKVMLPFFKMPAALTPRDASEVDLSQYKIVVLHYCTSFRNDLSLLQYNMTGYGPDDQNLKYWVESGGILIITAPDFLVDSQFFLAKEGIAWTKRNAVSALYQPVTFHCKPDIAEKYTIAPEYTLLAVIRELYWGGTVYYDQLPIGGVTEYGQGMIVVLPAFHNDTVLLYPYILPEDSNRIQKELANYIGDVVRGVANLHDKSGLLSQEVISPGEPFGLEWEDGESQLRVKTVFDRFGQTLYSEIIKAGVKIW